MKTLLTIVPMAALILGTAFAAQAETYKFEPNSKLVILSLESQMEIEDILGTTHSISGSADFEKGSFDLEVPVKTLSTGIDMRDDHLRREMWLDAEKFPTIGFSGDKLKDNGDGTATLSGQFELKGVKKDLKTTVKIRRIPAAQAKKLGLGEGDWLRVRGTFPLTLSDFGVTIPEMAAAKVADTWTVKVSLFGKKQ